MATATQIKTRNSADGTPRPFITTQRAIVIGTFVVFVASWEAFGRSVNPILFTYPTAILRALWVSLQEGEIQSHFLDSISTFVVGLGAALVVGTLVGLLLSRFWFIEAALEPYINAIYATPMAALVPLIIVLFGVGFQARSIVVFMFAVFPMIINTYQGVKNTPKQLIEVANSFCSSERELWRDVVIPWAIPYIMAGVRLALGRALVGMVIAEFELSLRGLGYMISRSAALFQMDRMFIPIIVLMILGVSLMGLIKRLERLVAPWNHGE